MTNESKAEKEKIQARDILIIPNLFTIIRLMIVCYIFVALFFEITPDLIPWLFIIAVVTDKLDGFTARRFKKITKLGESLDPVADNSLVIVGFSYITLRMDFPINVYYVLIIILLIGLLANMYYRLKSKHWWWGWIKGKFIDSKVPIIFGFILIGVYMFSIPGREWLLLFGGSIVAVLTLLDYFMGLRKALKNSK